MREAATTYAQWRPMPKRTVAVPPPTQNVSGTHAERARRKKPPGGVPYISPCPQPAKRILWKTP